MKKCFFMAIAVLAFLTACQNENETIINDGSIYFTNALTTRATPVTDATSLQNGFNVLGYAEDLKIFDNVRTKHEIVNGKSVWTVSPVKYWANNTTYNFFASYPSTNTFTTLGDDDEKNVAKIGNFVNDGNVDLVLAGRMVKTGMNEARTDAAQLVFKHALSRVRFGFANAYSDNDAVAVTVTVTDVALVNENKNGTVTITTTDNTEHATASGSTIVWSSVSSNNSNINFAFDSKEADFAGDGAAIAEDFIEATDYKYIIPTEESKKTVGNSYSLSCVITAYDENNNVIKQFNYNTRGNYIPLKVKKIGEDNYSDKLIHEAGKSYTYTMNIKSTLNEITFTVDVEDWVDGVGGEIDFPGDN